MTRTYRWAEAQLFTCLDGVPESALADREARIATAQTLVAAAIAKAVQS